MAYDKVIDSSALDAGMAATANAIRAKTGGSSPIAWDSANGFKAAVEEIADGGVELPELGDTAAQSKDMAAGKVLYDDEGNPVTGTLPETEVGTNAWAAYDIALSGTPGNTAFHIGGMYGKNYIDDDSFHGFICRAGTNFYIRNVPTSLFGDAMPDQVVKGVKFTSAAGLLVDGTHECEKGVQMRVEGETLFITGDVAVENGTLIL